jgi:hypothetical protein
LPEQKLLSLDSMNFSKTATALALVAMALTSCKAPESVSSESTPPAKETISVATACKKVEPLLTELNPIVTSIGTNIKENVSNDDNLTRYNEILNEIDDIAGSIQAEEGKGVIWDLTKAMDEFYKAVTNGENIDTAVNAVGEAATAYDAQCSK